MAKIVVVDDEMDTRTVVQMLLMLEGHEVITAGDGVKGLEAIREKHPDLVITDWMMPRMSGPELCRRLRGDTATRELPVIVHSAIPVEPDDSQHLYDSFMRKPVEFDDLLQTINALLAQPRTSH